MIRPSILVAPGRGWGGGLPLWPGSPEITVMRNRRYALRLVEKIPKGALSIGAKSVDVSALELLLCCGLLSGPATSFADRRIWSFYIEHVGSLCHAPSSLTLRMSDDTRNWDSHQKRGFSDRLGMGVAGWALWQHYGVEHIADAEPFISRALASMKGTKFHGAWLKRMSKDRLKPDFFCLDSSGEAVVAEAKGRIGAAGTVANAIVHGKKQVAAVTPQGVTLRAHGGRLVLGTNLRLRGDNPGNGHDSGLTVVDPEGDEPLAVEVSADEIARHSYANLFAFLGYGDLAAGLREGVGFRWPRGVIEESSLSLPYFPRLRVIPLLHLGDWMIGIDAGVALELFGAQRQEERLVTRLRPELARFGELRGEGGEPTETATTFVNGWGAFRMDTG